MAADLSGRTALVTGAARGLGGAIALALARAGANVVVHHDASASRAERLVEEIRGLGVGAWPVRCDLGEHAGLDELVDRARAAAGTLEILVNNASIFPESRLATVTPEELIESVRINAWAPLALARRFASTGAGGHVVNLLDTRVAAYDRAHVAYQASKGMLALFTRMMALEFAPNVAVNAVAPGPILQPERPDRARVESIARSLPLERVGRPVDVADAVLYLVRSEFVTGQIIHVDGGRHVRDLGGGGGGGGR